MRTASQLLLLATVVMVIPSHFSNAIGEIPQRSSESLSEEASLVLTGIVQRTYERDERRKHVVHTFSIAEIVVDSIRKGKNLEVGDRVFVRYWSDKKIDPNRFAPGHYGHWDVPSEGDTVVVFAKGDRKSGFDVLSPNGFYEVLKPVPSAETSKVK